jgi:CRISPR-associated protein Cmr4
MVQSSQTKGIPIIVYAVTPLHIGSGRSLGAVDLPIQRDPYNYPVVYSSSFKGALKSHCAKCYGLPTDEKSGRIDCSKAPECCCLFGPEIGNETGNGLLDISDLVPLLIPMPSLTHGYIYATSTYLLSKAIDMLEFVNEDNIYQLLKNLKSSTGSSVMSDVAGIEKPLINPSQSPNLQIFSVFGDMGELAKKLTSGVVVFNDNEGAEILERAYIRVTRNRIDLNNKTAQTHALWTEEYLPQGTILFGVLISSVPRKNIYCISSKNEKHDKDEAAKICDYDCFKGVFDRYLNKISNTNGNNQEWKTFYMVMGGKETVGKGLVKINVKLL